MRLTIDGEVYSPRGTWSVMPGTLESEADANLDGTIYITSKPVPAKAEGSISDRCGLSVEKLQKVKCTTITLDLDEVNRSYIFVNASIVGRPSLDISTGEISNVSIVAAQVRERNRG